MRVHGNTLYVQTNGAYLHKDGETVTVEVERQTKLTVPLHHLEGIVCFGRVSMSPPLMAECSIQSLPQAETLNVVRGWPHSCSASVKN